MCYINFIRVQFNYMLYAIFSLDVHALFYFTCSVQISVND